MPRSSQVHIDTALTNISVAYMQDAKNFIADRVFPAVSVQKQSDRYYVYAKEDFFRDEAKVRARASESAGGDYNVDNTPSYYCDVISFHKDVAEEDRANSDTPLDADTDATEFVAQKLLLNREKRWANRYFKTGVWGTDVTGTAENKWSLDSIDPVEVVNKAQTTVQSTTGFKPNKLTIGPKVFDVLRNHPAILDRIRYTQTGIVTTQLLAAAFGVDEVLVAQAVINSANQGAEEATDFIFGANALLTYAPARAGLKTPSAGYTFTWKGLLGGAALGSRISRIPMDWLGIGTERIEGEMAFDQKVVCRDLGYFWSSII